MNMEIIQNTHIIVHATGEIDLSNVAGFSKALGEASERSPGGFILDLTDVTYIDSAGVQAIFAVYGKMRVSEGCLIIIIGNVRIKSVLEVVNLERLPGVCVVGSLDDAMQMIPPGKSE